MQRPGRWVLIAMGTALLGLLGLIAAFILIPPTPRGLHHRQGPTDDLVPALAFSLCALILLMSLILALWALTYCLRRRRLLSGKGAVAAWRVPAADWIAFRARDADLAPVPSLRNRVSLAEEAPPEGVRIVFGERAFVVGQGVYGLGAGSTKMRSKWLGDLRWIDPPPLGGPAGLEILEYTYLSNGGYVLFVSRLPVPDAARGEALRTFEHFRRVTVPEKRTRLHEIFAADLAVARGDSTAIVRVEEKARRQTRSQWFSLVFGIAVVAGAWLWSKAHPEQDFNGIALVAVLGSLLLMILYYLVGDALRRK